MSTSPALGRDAPSRRLALAIGCAVLAAAWLTPLPTLLPGPFATHMARHMSVVAVAAPLLSLGIAGTRVDPLRRLPAPLLAIPASLVELVVVWVWHAPALHHAARASAAGFAAEQAMFLASALFVWLCACAGDARMGARTIAPRYDMGSSSGAGVIALLLTSMHMTLLGALLGLAPRALYHDASIAALADQHLGGALMLVVGGSSYLFGALWLTARLLKRRVDEPETSP